jgi:hypothetical protein
MVKFQNHPSRQRNEGKIFNINLSQLRAILNKEKISYKNNQSSNSIQMKR